MNVSESTINDLVARLPTEEADRLFEELEQLEGDTARRQAVRRALVAKLNALRQQHARRLFTELFQRYMTRDSALLRPEFASPGTLHPLDVGALWIRLVDKSIGPFARQADAMLAERAQTRPLRAVFGLPEVVALQADLAKRAAEVLTATLGTAGAVRPFLEETNRWRGLEAKRIRLGFDPRPLTIEDLRLMQGVLAQGRAMAELHEQLRRAARDPDALAAMVGNPAQGLDGRAAALVPGVGVLAPLALLHVDRNYIAGRMILLHGPQPWQEPTVMALTRHLGRTCFALTEEILGAMGVGQLVRPGLSLPLARRDLLDRELGNLDVILSLFEDLDLINHMRYGSLARDFLDRMVRRVEAELYPMLEERCLMEGRSAGRPIPDFEALDWTLAFCSRWRAVLKRSLFWGTGFSSFHDNVVAGLRDAYRGCFSRNGYASASQRLAHAIRLAQLGNRVGAEAGSWMGLMDPGLTRTVAQRLQEPEPLSGGEAALARSVLELAMEELRRTKHWRDPALQQFAEMAEARLATE